MVKMKNKLFHQLWPLILIIIFSVAIVTFTEKKELENLLTYIFNYISLSTFLGFAITLYSFNYNSSSKVKAQLESRKVETESAQALKEINQALKTIGNFYKESKDNLIFIFANFSLSVIMVSCKKIDLPVISWPLKKPLSGLNLINFFSLLILFSSLYALYDLLKSLVLINGREFLI
jgi:hypothetical protein